DLTIRFAERMVDRLEFVILVFAHGGGRRGKSRAKTGLTSSGLVWSDRIQDSVSFEDSKRFGKRHADMEAPPFARVPHPVDIETVRADAVDTGEGRIELFAAIVLHARPVTLEETISPRCPCALDIDYVIPLRWPDLRQETRFEEVANEGLASGDDDRLLRRVGRRRTGGAARRHPLLLSSHFFDPRLPSLTFVPGEQDVS
ncbi:MAG: hypothetical protein WBF12_11930, partial [Bradyrhizobium sp.]